MRLNVAKLLPRSAANGPGDRFVIWVQGCPLACHRCWNQDTWTFARRDLWDVDVLASTILSTSGIEGVTFSGGEPFSQARSLAALAKRLREANLSVFAFTGHELDELGNPDQRELLSRLDILVTGPYVDSLRSPHLTWRGSSNQVVHFFSDRYGPHSMNGSSQVEFHLGIDTHPVVTGFPVDRKWNLDLR